MEMSVMDNLELYVSHAPHFESEKPRVKSINSHAPVVHNPE